MRAVQMGLRFVSFAARPAPFFYVINAYNAAARDVSMHHGAYAIGKQSRQCVQAVVSLRAVSGDSHASIGGAEASKSN